MSRCSRCQAEFSCGEADAGAAAPCWCMSLPPLPLDGGVAAASSCLCPRCLRALLAQAGLTDNRANPGEEKPA
ncbi:MAG TPA: cysteine-rich CWC family protein [Oxalicibacterium sp.]|nr:cysteine-rich CWC family protein [Oxalicibacterium sp.]